MGSLIEVSDLVKIYPDGTKAVDHVSFDVSEGEIFGFLGPNGAGKTTTIRILVTLLPKTSGTAKVAGNDVDRHPEAVRRAVGYAAQFIGIDIDLTARENLILQGRLHGVAASEARRRAEELLEVFDLGEVATRRAGAFSGGMRRRLDLAQALVHRPPLLFLDEPTTGLDVQTRGALWQHLHELNRQGTTIFLTTQYLEEADRLAERLAIIDHGKIMVTGTPRTLKAELGGDVVTVTLPDDAGTEAQQHAISVLAGFPGTGQPTTFDRSVAVSVRDAATNLSDLIRRLHEAGVEIAKLDFSTPSLDEVFIRHTGERMRVEELARPESSMNMTRRRAAR